MAGHRPTVVLLPALMLSMLAAFPQEVSFPAKDGGIVFADLYGSGDRGVVLAHGARFDKASWKDQAARLAASGFRVVAIDFRGYGKSKAGPQANSEDLYIDVLAAVQYLRSHGANSVAVMGGSMGGGASANAVVEGSPGAIDRLILLAPVPIKHPEKLTGPKLFLTAKNDPIAPKVREQFASAPEPKELIVLDGAAHAQFLFASDQGERVMTEILRFLTAQ